MRRKKGKFCQKSGDPEKNRLSRVKNGTNRAAAPALPPNITTPVKQLFLRKNKA